MRYPSIVIAEEAFYQQLFVCFPLQEALCTFPVLVL